MGSYKNPKALHIHFITLLCQIAIYGIMEFESVVILLAFILCTVVI